MEKGIGIYIGRKEIVAASVSISKGVPELHQFAIEPIEVSGSSELSAGKKKTPSKDLIPEAQAVQRALEKIGAYR